MFILTNIALRISQNNLKRNYQMQEEARLKAQKRHLDALYGRNPKDL